MNVTLWDPKELFITIHGMGLNPELVQSLVQVSGVEYGSPELLAWVVTVSVSAPKFDAEYAQHRSD